MPPMTEGHGCLTPQLNSSPQLLFVMIYLLHSNLRYYMEAALSISTHLEIKMKVIWTEAISPFLLQGEGWTICYLIQGFDPVALKVK